MLRSTSVVITTTGASPLIALSPVSRPTRSAPYAAHEVAVLLVRQRLQRCRVEGLRPGGQSAGDRVLRHERLARAGRRGDEHRTPRVERVERARLELVQRKRPLRRERRPDLGGGHPALVVGVVGVLVSLEGVVVRSRCYPSSRSWPVWTGRRARGYRHRGRVTGARPGRPWDSAHGSRPGQKIPATTAHDQRHDRADRDGARRAESGRLAAGAGRR